MLKHPKTCPNGCEFAVRSTLLSYASREGERYVDAEYHWRCTKVDKLITTSSLIYELGCATYNYVRPAEPCTCTPQPAHEPEPIVPAVAVPVIIPEPAIIPQKIEPKFVPEQTVSTPAPEPVVAEPVVPKVRKPRSKPTATVTSPIPVISDTIPIVSAPADIPLPQRDSVE